MKTIDITRAMRNTATPAARLASWQNHTPAYRLKSIADYYDKTANMGERRKARIAAQGPELSSPEAESPLLWTNEQGPEVLETYAGRDCGLEHGGWFSDNFQEETLETYAVRLARFPHLLFYAVKDSCSEELRVHLGEWEGIDFSDVASEYQAQAAIQDAARALVRSYDSTTQREAAESQEYYRKDQVERDIEENRATLASLRHEIRALAHELKSLCPSSLASDYPAAGKAVLASLRSLLAERRGLMETNASLAASL